MTNAYAFINFNNSRANNKLFERIYMSKPFECIDLFVFILTIFSFYIVCFSCHQDCPSQYHKRRFGANCECVCPHKHRKCHRIHRGCLQLDEYDL